MKEALAVCKFRNIMRKGEEFCEAGLLEEEQKVKDLFEDRHNESFAGR